MGPMAIRYITGAGRLVPRVPGSTLNQWSSCWLINWLGGGVVGLQYFFKLSYNLQTIKGINLKCTL